MTDAFSPAVARETRWPLRQREFVNHAGGTRPHITLVSDEPGIRGLFRYRPETAQPLVQLSEVLLCGDSTLSRGEREVIAAYVSSLNRCRFCYHTHAAFAAIRMPEGMALIDQIRADPDTAPISPQLKALLAIAGAVQRGGQEVTGEHVNAARAAGATDLEIHDTVLIAAAFCMYNRYVDGLATLACDDPEHYADRARLSGYVKVWEDELDEAC
ncbi:carboxymuconolactone decarboxylase family protein [Nonomuraea sp. H19]|uniref:carboxymuconolactone decarboxylase family protein n=1 Tax=Nonomuraea sp. H19 TaxID=3452206 RepID=UPI003F891857